MAPDTPAEAPAPGPRRPPPTPAARVLLIGDGGSAGQLIAERLAGAGHRLAVHHVHDAVHASAARQDQPARSAHGGPNGSAPIELNADRTDADDMTWLVNAADRALDGLDALVILPGRHPEVATTDGGPESWADAWSHVLAADVLAAACATRAAARLFVTGQRVGRIILVVGRTADTRPAGALTSAADAAVSALAADLARELGSHGVAVSLLSVGPELKPDRVAAEIAETVTVLMTGAALPGITVRLGG